MQAKRKQVLDGGAPTQLDGLFAAYQAAWDIDALWFCDVPTHVFIPFFMMGSYVLYFST